MLWGVIVARYFLFGVFNRYERRVVEYSVQGPYGRANGEAG